LLLLRRDISPSRALLHHQLVEGWSPSSRKRCSSSPAAPGGTFFRMGSSPRKINFTILRHCSL